MYTVFHRNIAGPQCYACPKLTPDQNRVELRYCLHLCPQYNAHLKVTPGQIRFESYKRPGDIWVKYCLCVYLCIVYCKPHVLATVNVFAILNIFEPYKFVCDNIS